MAKSKHATALFEVLNKKKDGEKANLRVPSWFSHPTEGGAEAPGAAGEPPQDVQPPAAKEVAPERPVVAAIEVNPAATPRGRWFIHEADRVTVSLSVTSAAGVLVALLALISGAYSVGSYWGEQSGRRAYLARTGDEIEQAKLAPPNAELLSALRDPSLVATPNAVTASLGGPAASPAAPAHSGGPPVSWVKGNTYTVVQEFKPEGQDDARFAREFFAERGVATHVVTRPNGYHWLITAEGYNYKDSAQKQMGKVLAQRVKDLGKAYQDAGGRYSCEGYERTLSGDSW